MTDFMSETLIDTQQGTEDNGVRWRIETYSVTYTNVLLMPTDSVLARVFAESASGAVEITDEYLFQHPAVFGYDVEDAQTVDDKLDALIFILNEMNNG
jgi:hypothetical protein